MPEGGGGRGHPVTRSGDESAAARTPAPSSPAELAALLARDTAKWSAVVRAKKIEPD